MTATGAEGRIEAGPAGSPHCRALVGGFGVPGHRDLDLGHKVIRYIEPFRWPEGVVVEDLSYTAHLVLHRLQELRPPKLVLIGAVPRGDARPGTVRRRRLDPRPPVPAANQRGLAEPAAGVFDFEHTLAVLRHWGALPTDTVLIEVEPFDCSFGLGFSDELWPSFDEVLTMVEEEVGTTAAFDDEALLAGPPAPVPPDRVVTDEGPSAAVTALADYARERTQARLCEQHRGGTPVEAFDHPGVEVAGRSQGWGIGLQGGGDWYDVLPLDGGGVGVVIGDVPGRGAKAAALKADVRMAVQAYAVMAGDSPAALVESLDRFVAATGRGETTTLAYLTLDPHTGDVRLCSAGHCPPLAVDGRGAAARYLHDAFTPPLGTVAPGSRHEITTRLEPGETLILFTDGLVERPARPVALGLLELVEQVRTAPASLEGLCDHLLTACVDRRRREDDLSLLALRLRTTGG